MAQILCFGDSITLGFTDELGGWTQRMRRYLDAKYVSTYGDDILVPTHDVFNLGIPGDTSAGLLKRLRQEVAPRLLGDQTIIIIAIGTNDTVYRNNADDVECTPEQFKTNMNTLIAQTKEFTNDVILIGLLPCEDNKMQPMPWSSTGKSYSNERLSLFNDSIVGMAAEHTLSCVNIFSEALEHGPEKYLADGIHPNSEGHTLIAFETQHLVEKLLSVNRH